MLKTQLYLSTIDPQAGNLARQYGLGLEIAEFCTAWNMDDAFAETDAQVRHTAASIPDRLLHGPFNELCPCAVDPLARKLATFRFSKALELAGKYGARKLILHGGYIPRVYFQSWYVEQSVAFWREFLENHPGNYEICLENVLEETPEPLAAIVRQINDPRLRLCLDVGHANVYSKLPALAWVENWGAELSHVHVHNNDGTADTHSPLDCGTLPIGEILRAIPEATVTLELPEISASIPWLERQGIL